jgi:hypothetical protein
MTVIDTSPQPQAIKRNIQKKTTTASKVEKKKPKDNKQ